MVGLTPRAVHYAEQRKEIRRNAGGLFDPEMIEAWQAKRKARKPRKRKPRKDTHTGPAPVMVRDGERASRKLGVEGPEELARIIADHERFTLLSKGQVGSVDLLLALIAAAGRGCAVQVSVWRIGKDSILPLREMLGDGRIGSLRIVIDHAFAAITERDLLKMAITSFGRQVHETKIHAKMATVRGAGGDFAVRMSANLNRVIRWEQFDVDRDAGLCDFIDGFFAEIAGNIEPGFARGIKKVSAGFDASGGGSPPRETYRTAEAKALASEIDAALEHNDTVSALAAMRDGCRVDAALEVEDELGEQAPTAETLTAIRKRYERARADRAEMDRDKLAASLVPVTDARNAWFGHARATRDRLMSIADRIAAECAACEDAGDVHAIISDAVREACRDLAAGRMPHEDGEGAA